MSSAVNRTAAGTGADSAAAAATAAVSVVLSVRSAPTALSAAAIAHPARAFSESVPWAAAAAAWHSTGKFGL